MTVIGILSFVGSYNDFLWPLVVLSDDRKYTLTLGLNRLQGTFYTDPRLVAAGAIISLVPIVIFFALFQKNLFLGLQEGGLKDDFVCVTFDVDAGVVTCAYCTCHWTRGPATGSFP